MSGKSYQSSLFDSQEQKPKKYVPELDKLYAEVGSFRKSKDYMDLLKFIKKFPKIAPYNAMLVRIQRPGSEFVASASEWEKLFNRKIDPGAMPLIILQMFGPVGFVFELGDTYGPNPFPKEILDPFGVVGKVSETMYQATIENIKNDRIIYREEKYGTGMAGIISLVFDEKVKKVVERKYKSNYHLSTARYEMVVNSGLDVTTKFTTMLHELGHLYCGHMGTPNSKWWKDRRRFNLSLESMEFEAESVCWLICGRLGIENPSAEYLEGYTNKNGEIPDVSVDTILKATGSIESLIKGNVMPHRNKVEKKIQKDPYHEIIVEVDD